MAISGVPRHGISAVKQVSGAGTKSAVSVGRRLLIRSRGPLWRWEPGFPEAVHC